MKSKSKSDVHEGRKETNKKIYLRSTSTGLCGSSGSRFQHTICTTSFVIDLEISKKDLDQQGKNVMLEKNTRRHKGSSFTWLDISDSVI